MKRLASLTMRERWLVLAAASLLCIMGTWLVWDELEARHARLLARLAQVQREIRESQRWLDEEKLWNERRAWLDDNLPSASSVHEASTRFLELVQQAAGNHRLKIENQSLLDPVKSGPLVAAGIRVVLRGRMQDLVHWSVEIQQPGLFVESVEFDIRPLPDSGQIECTASFLKWHRLYAEAPAVGGDPASIP